MSTTLSIANGKSNLAPAEVGRKKRKPGIIHLALVRVFKDLQEEKTWGAIAELLGLKERTAKHRVFATRSFSDEDIAAMLRSEHGFEFLTAMMGDARPTWWRILRPLMEVAETQKMQERARRRLQSVIKGALDADRDLTAACARAEALAVQDQEFMGSHIDALRATGGLPRGAMAATTTMKIR